MQKSRFLLPLLLALSLFAGLAQAQFGVCNPPCLSCMANSTTMCQTCVFNYKLSGNFCVPLTCEVLYCQNCWPDSTMMCI